MGSLQQEIVVIAASIGQQTLKLYHFESFLANYTSIRQTLGTLDEISDHIAALRREYAPEIAQNAFIASLLKAFQCYIEVLQGDAVPYERIMSDIQEIPMEEVTANMDAVYDTVREKVEKGLADFGYTGSLAERIHAFEEAHHLKAEEVVRFAKGLVQRSKQESEALFVSLPPEDGIDAINGVTNVFWSGYSRYLGNHKGELSFNLDRQWSWPSFVSVLVHEGYPGHQYTYSHWEGLYREHRYPTEAAWYLLGTPANSLFEGVAENANHFLKLDSPEGESLGFEPAQKRAIILARDIADLKRIIQTKACFLFNRGEVNEQECLQYMTADKIMRELDCKNTFAFFSHAIQRLTYPSYYYGRWLVEKAYDQCPEAKRRELFHLLYETPMANSCFLDAYQALTGIRLCV